MSNNTTQNWLKRLYEATPKGEIAQKTQQAINSCGISERTFYRYVQTGHVPNVLIENKLKQIFAKSENILT